MFDFSVLDWIVCGFCAFVVGINKTAIPGIGTMVVPLLVSVARAKPSVGLLLPMLIMGDVFALVYYRRHAVWQHLIKLIPCAIVGVLIGWRLLGKINDEQLKPIIGIIVITLLILDFWRRRAQGAQAKVPTQWWFAAGAGVLAGITTMMANAAGPVMVIYLLAMRLDKTAFIGTAAWYFFLMNWFKVPFYLDLDLITRASLKIDFMMFPLIAAGAITGIFVLKRIPQKTFVMIAQALAFAAGIKLLF